MAKTVRRANSTFTNLGFNPDVYAGALAHIIKVETTDQGRRETVLGQAWLAGIGKLVTCGHVVEPHMTEAGSLIVTFPYSGNRYPITEIKLHPSFARQPDGLVKFDAALLLVELNEPELSANILPIVYEKVLSSQLGLTAVRYPVHLGQYSSALNPLAQSGRLLGPLRKNDDYHLLHDTALAPGDSGAPIFDHESLVALHCGDTATLPGLNLATTSIRLALWVDALRDLGIEGHLAQGGGTRQSAQGSPALLIAAFWLVFLATLGGVCAYRAYPALAAHKINHSGLKPVNFSFNKGADEYEYYEKAIFQVMAQSPCFFYLYVDSGNGQFQRIFPNFPKLDEALDPGEYTLQAGSTRLIEQVGNANIRIDCDPSKLHLFVLNTSLAPLDIHQSYERSKGPDGSDQVEMTNTTSEVNQARALMNEHPGDVLEFVIDTPQASKQSREKYERKKTSS